MEIVMRTLRDREGVTGGGLYSAADFGEPPAQTDEEEAPVLKELWRLAFKAVTEELQQPAEDKHADRHDPEAGHKNSDPRQRNGGGNQGDTEGMTGPVYRMLMTLCVLRDPFIPGFSTEHL